MTKAKTPALIGALAIMSLTACEKSACSYTPDSDRIVAADQMATCLNSMPVTPAADMPTSGSATYTGFMAGSLTPAAGAVDQLLGDASVTANFTTGGGTVAGTVSNITSTTNGDLGGTLDISGGVISGFLVGGANLNGTLTGYNSESITIDGTLAGGFSGSSAQGISLATTLAGAPASVTFSTSAAGTADLVVSGLE